MRSGKPHRWSFPFRRSSAPSSPSSPSSSSFSPSSRSVETDQIPMEFLCPISSSLMADPVIIPSGQSFDRPFIQACRDLSFSPPSLPSSSSAAAGELLLIPNVALKSAILNWCDRTGRPQPLPLSPKSARSFVERLMNSQEIKEEETHQKDSKNNNNPALFSPPSSSSYNSSSSSSSFSSDETLTPKLPLTDPFEDEILAKLKNPQLSTKESALISIRQAARESKDRRISLCTQRILAAVVPFISSRTPSIQINATAAIVNLSIEPCNKIPIVRSGAVPPLIDALRCGDFEARDNAAGAIFSLSLEEENRLAIGVLGAIPPLLHLFARSAADLRARKEAGMALYHLTLSSNNLTKLARTAGAVRALVAAAAAEGKDEGGLRRVAMMVMRNLAGRKEGRAALMDDGAVEAVVGMLKGRGIGREEELQCLVVLYGMSKGSLRFRALARAAGAEEAVAEGEEGRGEVAKEMVRRILRAIRGGGGEEAADEGVVVLLGDEDERSSVSDELLSFRRRLYEEFGGGSGSGSGSGSASNSAGF